jgi:predicted nucleic acid-binding protein
VRKAVLLEERSQGPQARLVNSGQEARERAAVRELLAAKERHEGAGKGRQPLIKGGQGPLATDGVAKEYRQKIDHFVAAHAASRQMHLVTDRSEDSTAAQVVGQ